MDTSKSAFVHFGILPSVSIYSPIEDEYSKMYTPREKCDCGNNQWIDSTMKIIQDSLGYEFPKKRVHRCSKCNKVRTADHIGIKDDI